MDWGEQGRRGIYKDFWKEMTVAMGVNRVTTEAQIRLKDPLGYAKHVWRKEPEWAPLQEKLDIGVTHGIDSELEQAFLMLVEAEVASRLRNSKRAPLSPNSESENGDDAPLLITESGADKAESSTVGEDSQL